MNTIEAKLRIRAETAQAVAEIKKLDEATRAVTNVPAGQGGAAAIEAVKVQAVEAGKASVAAQAAVGQAAAVATQKIRSTAQQLALLRPQLTDTVVGLSTGQSAFTVLLQQGGQLGDVFGGFGNVLKALGQVFTPLRIAVGGTAAAVAGVALAIFEGRQESKEFAKALAIMGNVAGVTAGQFTEAAQRIATSQKVTIGNARETLKALLDTGQFTGSTFESAGRAVVAITKLTGQSSDETIKSFTSLTGNVAAGALKLNQSYNFLTVQQHDYIRSLEAQGRSQEAIKVTLDALSSTIEGRSAPLIGTLERAWIGVKSAVSGVLDSLKDIGREQTAEQKLAKIIKLRDDAAASGGIGTRGGRRQTTTNALVGDLQTQVEAAEEVLRLQKRSALEQSERAAANNDALFKDSKAFKDLLANLDLSQSQKLLAQQIASLDQQKSVTDRAFDAGLVSAEKHAVDLNRIDQRRLQAQAAFIQKSIDVEGSRVLEKPGDEQAQQTKVNQLKGQLISVNAQVAQTASQGQGIVSAAAVAEAEKDANRFAAIWQKSFDQVALFARAAQAARATTIADPQSRAQAEADAATQTLRDQIKSLDTALQLQLLITWPDDQRALLEQQIAQLAKSGAAAIAEANRAALANSLTTQAAQVQQTLSGKEGAVNARVNAGLTSQAEGEQQILDLRRQQIPVLDGIIAALQLVASSEEDEAKIQALKNQLIVLKDQRTELERTARSSAISSISTALTDIETGAKTGKQALLDMVSSFGRAMLDLLNKKLAEKLVGGFLDLLNGTSTTSGGGSTQVAHAGAVIGGGSVSSSGSYSPNRSMPASAFRFAPRYHGGGVAGLMPDEVPAVLRRGETVRTVEQERTLASRAGGMSIVNNVTISGPQSGEPDGRSAANELTRVINGAIEAWAAREGRAGGRLAR